MRNAEQFPEHETDQGCEGEQSQEVEEVDYSASKKYGMDFVREYNRQALAFDSTPLRSLRREPPRQPTNPVPAKEE